MGFKHDGPGCCQCGYVHHACLGCPPIPETIGYAIGYHIDCETLGVFYSTLTYRVGTFTYLVSGVPHTYTGGFWRSDAIAGDKAGDICNGIPCTSYYALIVICRPGTGLENFIYGFFQSASFPDLPDLNPGHDCSGHGGAPPDSTVDDAVWVKFPIGGGTFVCSPPANPDLFPPGATTFGFGAGGVYYFVP